MQFITNYLKKRKTEKRNLQNINKYIECKLKQQYFMGKALNSHDSLVDKSSPKERELIVSLTTYSKRIHDVHLVIESLGEQTQLANRIILWLDREEFSINTIPLILKKQIQRGLEVRFCSNYRSYKKLIPTVTENPDSDVITIDDDFLYPHDLIELLVKGKSQSPETIIGMRAHKIVYSSGGIASYRKWKFEAHSSNNGPLTFLTTGAGTLFPAGILPSEICNSELFLSTCPNADDVWINFMCIKHNIKRVKVSDNRDFSSRFLEIESGQDIALNRSNVHENQNDAQIEALIDQHHISLS